MTPTETKRVTDALDMNAVRREVRSGNYTIGSDLSRDEFNSWVDDLDGERESFIGGLKQSAKIEKLPTSEKKLSAIVETGSDNIGVNADSLTVRGAHYYESFFKYTNHTTWAFKIQGLNGCLKQVRESAKSTIEAQNILRSHCEDLSDPMYGMAADDIPVPLMGKVDGSNSPRLFHFEDKNHLYVEYWTEGGKKTMFDVRTGDSKTCKTLKRTCFRIHLDSQLVEITGDSSRKPNRDALSTFLKKLNKNQLLGEVVIGASGIQKVKDKLAFIVSLDEFDGEDAKIRFAKNNDGNVEADPYHSATESDRERVRTNMQLLYGRIKNQWELIRLKDVAERYSAGEEVKFGELLKDLNNSDRFDIVFPLTVGLNREKNSIRFHPENISPPVRQSIFRLFAKELGWY